MANEQIASLQVDVGFYANTSGSQCLEQGYTTGVVVVRVYWHQICIVDEGVAWVFPFGRTTS